MHKNGVAWLCFALVIWAASAVAQGPAAGDTVVLKPVPASQGSGVSNATLLSRPEVRVLRVDVAPGGVRVIHTHDDTQFHLLMPIAGNLQVEVEPNAAVSAGPWQPQFIKGGTRHGFRNTGTQTATIVEVFVQK